MATFIPDFNNSLLDDAYKMELNDKLNANKSFEVDILKSRGEFIFLLDRSYSMSGCAMEKAK